MSNINQPPTSGFTYQCAEFMHRTRHYLDKHEPIGEAVQESTPGEQSGEEVETPN